VTSESGSVAAGALNPDPLNRAVALQPRQQLLVSRCCRGEAGGPQYPAEVINCRGHMDVKVGVDAAGDGSEVRCHCGHVRSLSVAFMGHGPGQRSDRTGTGLLDGLLRSHFHRLAVPGVLPPGRRITFRATTAAGLYQGQTGRENQPIQHPCLYLVTRSLDPTGTGQARWAMRWKPALNAFAITFGDRFPAAEAY
jgi:hypothetical protein